MKLLWQARPQLCQAQFWPCFFFYKMAVLRFEGHRKYKKYKQLNFMYHPL